MSNDGWWMCSGDLPVLFRRVFAPTSSLVDLRATYIIPVIMVEVFLGISNSEWRMYVEEMLSGVAGIEDRSERGTWGKWGTSTSLRQPIVKSLEGKVSISMPQRVEGNKRRTLSLVVSCDEH
jgi:hypothetical protein